MPQNQVFIRERLILDPATGTIEFVYRARPVLSGATAEAAYRVQGRARSLSLREGEVAYGVAENVVSLSRGDGQIQLTWNILVTPEPDDQVSMWLEVTNVGPAPVQVDELRVLALDVARGSVVELGAPPDDWSFYQNGWQSWSPTFARHVANGLHVDPATEGYRTMHQPHPLPAKPKTLTSEWFTVISPKSAKPSLLLGFVTAGDQLSEIRLEVEREGFLGLEAICHADGVALAPGAKLTSEQLLVAAGHDPLALLDRYTTRLGQNMEARIPAQIPIGWCSWYYFYGENSSADVLANVEGIDQERLPLEVILIDDGYEAAIGDWLIPDGEKFPEGMGWLAQRIRAAGHVPALWVAPFAASSQSRLYAEHPDWVIRDEGGQPLLAWQHFGEDIYALDLTHPAVQEWLRSLFRTLSDEWGYELFKLDFLYAGALAGGRHDPQVTRAQALRRGLEIIREAVGQKILLGCGAPLGPCVGLVDAMRIGPDVAINWRPFWPDLSAAASENALRNVVARAFLHGRLWANDPDCVLVRTRDDESDLVLNEMRTLVSLVGLSGGLVLWGDNFPTVRPGRLKYLRQILPPYGQAAMPLDLFENELPELFVLPVQREFGQWLVAGVINWGDRTRDTTVDLARLGLEPGQPYHAYHYWRRRYLGVVCDRVIIPRHQPHETALLLLKPASEEPQFLTSTFHVTQGGVEVKAVDWAVDDRGRRVVVTLEKVGRQFGELLFAVPEPWCVTGARLDGRRRGVNQIAPGVVGMGFHLEGRTVVEVDFWSTSPHGERWSGVAEVAGDDLDEAKSATLR